MATRRGLRTILLLSAAFSISIPLFIVGCTGAGTGGGFDPAAGLIHYYPFSGDADDACDGSKNGTVVGALLTVDRHGSADSAYSFDGNDSILLDYFPAPDSFTLTAWIMTADPSGNILLWEEVPSSPGTDDRSFRVTENCLSFVENNGMTLYPVTGDTVISPDTWVHVAAVKSGSSLTIYVDGAYETEGTLSLTLTTNELTVGYSFTGSIDEVRVYDQALGQSDIQKLAGM